MKKTAFSLTLTAAAVWLAGSTAARALDFNLNAVTPLSNFSFDITGFDFSSGTGYYLTPQETATFGATTTFTGAGVDGQNITITSSENIGVTTTTDTFTVSTPTNFINEATITSMGTTTTINTLQFDLGDATSGGGMVSLAVPISFYTSATGSAIYGTTSTATLTPTTMLAAGGGSYAAVEGVNTGVATTPINTFTVHSFTYVISYPTLQVPEPSTWVLLGLGTAVGVVAMRRRVTH